MKQALLAILAIATLLIIAFVILAHHDFPDTPQSEMRAAVDRVQSTYLPTREFWTLKPDISTKDWRAGTVIGNKDCIGHCLQVELDVDVMPQASITHMQFKWLCDSARPKPIPINTEARMYFFEPNPGK